MRESPSTLETRHLSNYVPDPSVSQAYSSVEVSHSLAPYADGPLTTSSTTSSSQPTAESCRLMQRPTQIYSGL